MLNGKNILLGVCGSIASYKAATLIRLLVEAGANVQVVMTQEATQFITPLTLSTLSKNPVLVDYYKVETGEWNNHVHLGLWANLILIAPVSANTMAKMASGFCDNLLSAVYLSAKCPVYFAPAMDLDMWKHPSTQSNLQKLLSYRNILIKPAYGQLASGLVGEGRMEEPAAIVDFLEKDLNRMLLLSGKKCLVTAGPTYEAIDPVRFIGNQSSGKMGFKLAEELASMGAEVTLIAGPSNQQIQHKNIKRINVVSAEEMLQQCLTYFPDARICIMNAAVADFTPKFVADQKMKKQDQHLTIELKPTVDILQTLGAQKQHDQLLVGFALETNDGERYAIDKLQRKNLDLIILNTLADAGAGFKTDTNKVTMIDKNLQKIETSLKSKTEIAADICQKIIELLEK
ncbi:MAG: bifunctional phosphopantothenoylcysteine decarboxylase/phosphopantothenate--cysteine ligase CoaBC [Sphingobacteriaceae bacterium]|nr:MAG: bifunctional phosphopantothenoylcysteine decarboxylase/phosphopantothenate--cysteine ligase CoaBC [Sphingobacteriaceae bacterium]